MTQIAPVIRAAWVERNIDDAFRIFTDEIGAWWPLPTHGLFGADAATVGFRDGFLVEQSVDGSEVIWGEVQTWEPPTRLVISWHPGGEADSASQVEVSFEQHQHGTRVVIEHRGWEVFGEHGLGRRKGYARPNAWGYVLDHFGDVAEPGPHAPDLKGLTDAYQAFFAEAALGGFGPPPEGEWSAAQTIAHVTLNDAAMASICHRIVHGGTVDQATLRFENEICQDPGVLERFIERGGGVGVDVAGLISRGRAISRVVVAALRRLSPDQLQTMVHCCLTHDGETMVDQPMPWGVVAIDVQASRHLTAHIEQLQNLRIDS